MANALEVAQETAADELLEEETLRVGVDDRELHDGEESAEALAVRTVASLELARDRRQGCKCRDAARPRLSIVYIEDK